VTGSALVLALVPAFITGQNLDNAAAITSLAVILLSITAITGFTGNITLGQAGFAGLGAILTSRMTTGNEPWLPHWPVIPSMLLSSVIVGMLGALTGYSALRRKGLFLGLTTLAVGLVLYRFIFESPYFASRVIISRPNLFGLSLDGGKAFYWFTLVCLGLAMLVVDRMRRGHFGRVLAAMRDSENGARSIGLDLRRYKLIIFSSSAGLAAFGGSLLAQQQRGFDPLQFDPFHSFFWFTAVLVAGASYLTGSILGGALFIVLDVWLGDGASTLVIGVLALVISRMPSGIVGLLLSLRHQSVRTPGLSRVLSRTPAPTAATEQADVRPSAFALRLLGRTR
jgi:branched-chain amino acid transport system permease protein